MRTAPVPSSPTHITYRLYGSIPNLGLSKLHGSHLLRRAKLEEDISLEERATDTTARKAYRQRLAESELDYYVAFDTLLDKALQGPRFLQDAAAKQVIIDSWKFIARRYGLRIYAISVMSNHVHVLLENRSASCIPLADMLTEHKRFTATQLNRMQDAKGRRVWAEKEYSRTVRFGHFERTLWYVLNNPVKAGLTDDPSNWCGNYYTEEMRRNFVEARALAG